MFALGAGQNSELLEPGTVLADNLNLDVGRLRGVTGLDTVFVQIKTVLFRSCLSYCAGFPQVKRGASSRNWSRVWISA